MGGGSSSLGVEEMLQATFMLGRAIASVTFPGMFSPRAPKLRNAKPVTIFSPDESDSEDEANDAAIQVDPSDFENMFKVTVGDDVIYLEDPLEVNESGWTPLHTCCMSYLTVQAGLDLIDETVRLKGDLDVKTILGPGNFNSGWTPLHMAAAYGIEPLVVKLLTSGADPNTIDSHGYTPLLEACHRGYIAIATALVKGRARLDYIPSTADAASSPFNRAPPQAALAESARCGFNGIVQMLVDAGAPKNQSNTLGWTALHEASFYNRIEVVKILMLNGANASLRTKSGALPYHFSGLQIIRNMLKEMGGPDVVPDEEDVIDMSKIMKELTIAGIHGKHQNTPLGESLVANNAASSTSRPAPRTHRAPVKRAPGTSPATAPPKSRAVRNTPKIRTDVTVEDDEEEEPAADGVEGEDGKDSSLLHSGPLLGALPSLSNNRMSPAGKSPAYGFDDDMSPSGGGKSKHKKQKKKSAQSPSVPKDTPTEYLCELCHRLMSDPVRTEYGNVFDRTVILKWIKEQGQICPLTGMPLSETNLKPENDLKAEIQRWILSRSMSEPDTDTLPAPIATTETSTTPSRRKESKGAKSSAGKVQTEDLYDF